MKSRTGRGFLTGGVSLDGVFYSCRAPLAFGRIRIEPIRQIDAPAEVLTRTFARNPEDFWKVAYCACDVIDLAYGSNEISNATPELRAHLANAKSHIAAFSQALQHPQTESAAIQSSWMAAELSMKAGLIAAGVPKSQRSSRALGHNISSLAECLIENFPSSHPGEDDRLRRGSGLFPRDVADRYELPTQSSAEIHDLAMASQFLAASVVRRLARRDIAFRMELDPDSPGRIFP